MNKLRDLLLGECLELLRTAEIGRVAIQTPAGLRIVPVNFGVYGDSVVWRTEATSELARYGSETTVAIEVDCEQDAELSWSVVIVGRAELVKDPDVVADIRRTADPHPWPGDDDGDVYVTLPWRDMSGRCLVRPVPRPSLAC